MSVSGFDTPIGARAERPTTIALPSAGSRSVFVDVIDRLTSDAFRDHFLGPRDVVPPHLPTATPAALEEARAVLCNRFRLVGEAYTLPEQFSWKVNPSHDKEWQIAHHKFGFGLDLVHAFRRERHQVYLEKWVSLLESWLDEMGSGFITASDAQVEAKRIEHWVYSLLLLRNTPCRDVVTGAFLRRLLERISEETWHVSQHLKPVRNHRTFQLWAVFLVGVVFPELRLHRYFVETGRALLTENLLADFRPDGVHVEHSTHYHQLVAETALAFVDLARRNGIALDPALRQRLARALRFSLYLQWPNGDIPLIGDSDNGDHRDLLRRGSHLMADDHLRWGGTLGREGTPPHEPSVAFADAGYFVFGDGWGRDTVSYARRQHVLYDCGPLGEGSHSHYDLFSFTYFCNGRPAVIDPGRYTYSAAPDASGVDWRRRFKSTAYHNTVAIDGRDQTRYISKYGRPRGSGTPKHGPAVEVADRDFHLGPSTDWVVATARGAEYTPRHRRLFLYPTRQYLLILDVITADDEAEHEAASHLHLPPDQLDRVTIEVRDADVAARTPLSTIHAARVDGLEVSVERGWTSTTYGVKEPAPVLTLVQRAARPMVFCTAVAPAGDGDTAVSVRTCALLSSPIEPVLVARVDGTIGREPFTDWLLCQPGASHRDVRHLAVGFRGPFALYRTDAHGRVTHLVAGRPERLSVAGGPRFDGRDGGHVEWST